MSATVKIFIAYSRKDSEYLDEIRTHFAPLERSGKVTIWYDGKIESGSVWENEIKERLHGADIILLLVSADAIASDYFYDEEMIDALERHKQGTAKVVPFILRLCAWKETPLADLQAIPQSGKAVISWKHRDEAYSDAVNRLSSIINIEVKLKLEAERNVQKEKANKEKLVVTTKRQIEEEQRLKLETEAKQKAEEEKRIKEEVKAKQKAEEQQQLKKKAEAKRKAEEERQLKKKAEAKLKAEEEQQLKKKAETKRKGEEEQQLKKEAEAKQKAEEQQQLKKKAEAKRKAEEEQRLKKEAERTDRLKEKFNARKKFIKEEKIKKEVKRIWKEEADQLKADFALKKSQEESEYNPVEVEQLLKETFEDVMKSDEEKTLTKETEPKEEKFKVNEQGVVLFNQEKYSEAMDKFSEAIELDPESALYYNNRGSSKSNLGDNEGAIEDYDKAIELDPEVATYYNNRGNSKYSLGDNEAAIEDFDKAIDLDLENAVYYRNRGNSKAQFGDNEGAKKDFELGKEAGKAVKSLKHILSNRYPDKNGFLVVSRALMGSIIVSKIAFNFYFSYEIPLGHWLIIAINTFLFFISIKKIRNLWLLILLWPVINYFMWFFYFFISPYSYSPSLLITLSNAILMLGIVLMFNFWKTSLKKTLIAGVSVRAVSATVSLMGNEIDIGIGSSFIFGGLLPGLAFSLIVHFGLGIPPSGRTK